MKELLYLDRDRFDQYSAQATPSLATIEKTKELAAEFSITGPRASFEQKERVRALTDFEKMNAIITALRTSADLRTARPETDDDGPAFVLETCEAVKVIIPYAARNDQDKSPEMVVWFAAPPAKSGSATLCLVEDYRGEDSRPISFRQASTYTLLQSLVHYGRSHRLRTRLDNYVPDDPHPNPYAKFDGKPDSLAQYHNVKDHAFEFSRAPAGLLREWGCLVSSGRQIEVLYRIREFGRDGAYAWERVTVFGYPIWITAA
jgi:hypothetical protein